MAADRDTLPHRLFLECPTCGSNVPPEDTECSVCGTTLRSDDPLSCPQDESTPTIFGPPESAALAPTVNLPPPSPPPSSTAPGHQVKAAQVSSSSPLPSRPAPLPRRVDFPPTQPIAQSVPSRPASLRGYGTFKRTDLIGAALALIILSFLAGYFIKASTQNQETSDGPMTSSPAQGVGQVTTADQLMPISVFGADLNDKLRGVAVFRTHVESGFQRIRDAYAAQLETNPSSLGTLVIEFHVTPAGQVSRTALHVTGSLSPELQQRTLSIVKDWRFPPTQGREVKVFYPVLLAPGQVEAVTLAARLTEVWPGWYKVLAATSIRVRAQAKVDAQDVGEIGPGLRVYVIGSREGWLEVLSEGEVGYIPREAISPRVENPTPAR